MKIGGKKETEKNIKGRADKNTVYRTLFSVLGALLVYEAGKMAGLLLAGALIGGGENAEEMLNSGLTGGLANLIMILTGGLACFALWKPFLHFRPAKRTERKEILPFFIMAAALALWCGERKGRRREKLCCWGSSERSAQVSVISSSESGGRMPGRRCASMDLPVPGGPLIRMLGPPAAAISSASRAVCWPFTSCRSG